MRRSKALAKIRNGEPVRICSLGHDIPAYIRHAAEHRFDCLWLDQEHRTIDYRALQALIAECHRSDIDCMVRVPTRERARLYRYLEDGATGLMIPHVSTAEMARDLVEAVKFPPLGNRGLDGAGFDGDYWLQGKADYPAQANQETFLVVQIESPEAVENVDAIAAVEGVDALFIGPGDLGLRLQLLDTNLTMEECFSRVAEAAKKHGKAWGLPVGTVEQIKALREQGALILAHGGEFQALIRMLEEWSKNLDQAM